MIQRLLPLLSLLYAMLVMCGCTEHEYNDGPVQGTSLTVTFQSTEERLETRGVEDLDDNGNV